MDDGHLATWLILLGDFLLRVAFAIRVVFRRVPVPTALGWLVLILLVPGLGIPIYLLVGEVRLGTRRARLYMEVARGLEERAHVFWRGGAQDWTGEAERYRHISRLLTGMGEMPPLVGNHLTVAAARREFIDGLVTDIDRARRWCHLLYYIWSDDECGRAVGEAMIRAAGRKVECRVLVDAVGSKRFLRSAGAQRMREAGVRVVAALPVNPLRALFQRIDVRNHRKVAVIDGWIGWTGSHNVTDPSYGHKPRSGIGPWIDASVRVEGPAAQALEIVFLHDWQMETGEEVKEITELLPDLPVEGGGCIVQVAPSGPVPRPDAIQEAILTTIHAARRELILTTPYFVPDEATKMALVCAARQGVTVTLVVPRKLDGRLVAAASKAYYEELLEAGVRIMEHHPGLLHSKTLTVDADMALIGSTNLDIRSFRLNFEATLFVFDSDFASHLRMLQAEYVNQSTEVLLRDWRNRPKWNRFKENLARLASPLL